MSDRPGEGVCHEKDEPPAAADHAARATRRRRARSAPPRRRARRPRAAARRRPRRGFFRGAAGRLRVRPPRREADRIRGVERRRACPVAAARAALPAAPCRHRRRGAPTGAGRLRVLRAHGAPPARRARLRGVEHGRAGAGVSVRVPPAGRPARRQPRARGGAAGALRGRETVVRRAQVQGQPRRAAARRVDRMRLPDSQPGGAAEHPLGCHRRPGLHPHS